MLICNVHAEHVSNGLFRTIVSLTDESGTMTAGTLATLQDVERLKEDLSWYFERHGELPERAAEALGMRVRADIGRFGDALFEMLFTANEDARAVWERLSPRLGEVRFEIVESRATGGIPWEWIREPSGGRWLALSCAEFVRTSGPARAAERMPVRGIDALRILLVISRPFRGADVPFRPVADAVWTALSEEDGIAIEFTVLRPPTFEQLQVVLEHASRAGRPYQVVHFDGHGVYQDLLAEPGVGGRPRGYLVFEGPPAILASAVYVEGRAIGEALAKEGVRHLILNACRSGYAPLEHSAGAGHDAETGTDSVAEEALEAGLEGAVAMKYDVTVSAASRVVAAAYEGVSRGLTCGEVATRARRVLLDPDELDPLAWAHWLVPVAFARPQLLPGGTTAEGQPGRDAASLPPADTAPPRPPVESLRSRGFAGRDEILLELDRLFDLNGLVLLHGPPGQGTTTTAQEFGRWYYLTSGVMAPLIFTRLDQCESFSEALDDIGRAHERNCARYGFDWFAEPEDKRRAAALQLLRLRSTLWILDGAERVCGIGAADSAAWAFDDRGKLVDFLQRACAGGSRVLLTSCRDEQAWLGGLPGRVPLRAMKNPDRVDLLVLVAKKNLQTDLNLDEWHQVLTRTAGHPATLIGVADAIYAAGGDTDAAAVRFAHALDPGGDPESDASRQLEVLVEPLAARLRQALAGVGADADALYLFAHCVGCVDLYLLAVASLQEVGVDNQALLERVYERGERPPSHRLIFDALIAAGLLEPALTSMAGMPHPLLPLALERVALEQTPPDQLEGIRAAAERRFVTGLSFYLNVQDNLLREIGGAMEYVRAHHSNARHALDLAIFRGWIDEAAIIVMVAGRSLELGGRWDEWDDLVSCLAPFVPEPASAEDEVALDRWRVIADARVAIDRARGDIESAAAAQDRVARHLTAAAERAADPEDWEGRKAYDAAAQAWIKLGQVLALRVGLSGAEVGEAFRQALAFARRSDLAVTVADCLLNLGQHLAASDDPAKLNEAQAQLRESLERRPTGDRRGRAICHGLLARTLVRAADSAGARAGQPIRLDAVKQSERALRLLPPGDPQTEANLHFEAQRALYALGRKESAMKHLLLAVERFDEAGDWHGASSSRLAAAARFHSANRLDEARSLAESVVQVADRAGAAGQEFRDQAAELLKAMSPPTWAAAED